MITKSNTAIALLGLCFCTNTLAEKSESASDWVELAQLDDSIVIDLPYATTNNVFRTKFYEVERAFLRREVALKLVEAHQSLSKHGVGLKVWDAYRPHPVQHKMWEISPTPGYVGNPERGSRHNRGAAVDVTLVHLATGIEVSMPTPYDEFSPRAHANDFKLPRHIAENRALLQKTMRAHGFTTIGTEWWHFDYAEWKKFPLEEISIKELAKLHPRIETTRPDAPQPGTDTNRPESIPLPPVTGRDNPGLPTVVAVTRDREKREPKKDSGPSKTKDPAHPEKKETPPTQLRAVPVEPED